jgi:hypothetical protein
MTNWNNVADLTPGMTNLGNQFNARWEDRDTTSDGARGDAAHAEDTSGHNADDTKYRNAEWEGDSDNIEDIRAIDVTCKLNDPTLTSSTDPQAQMQVVIDHMRRLPNLSTVIRYMIFDRKKYHYSTGFAPENYTGSNPHDKHAHFSGAWSEAADQNTTFDFKFEEVGEMQVTLSNLDKDDIATRVHNKRPWQEADPGSFAIATQRDYDRIKATAETVTTLAADVDTLKADNEEMKGQLAAILELLTPSTP